MWDIIMVSLLIFGGFFWASRMKYDKKTENFVFNFSKTRFVLVVLAVVPLFIFLSTMIFQVGPGEVGVIFDPLGGGVLANEAGEGYHLKAPWQSINLFNVRLQDYTMSLILEEGILDRDDRITAITNEGLSVDLDITVWYRIVSTNANVIRQEIGRDGEYQTIVVRPQIRSSIREVVASHTAVDVYGENRQVVVNEISTSLEQALSSKNIIVERILLRNVVLPQTLTDAIEAKKSAEQNVMRMQYVLETENLEAARKVIEASGIADANRTISGSLTSSYLRWYWISNLDQYESVIYVPVGDDGLPLFRDVTWSGGENVIGT